MILEYTFRTWRGAPTIWDCIADFADPWWLGEDLCHIETEGEGPGMIRRLYWRDVETPATHRLDVLDKARGEVVFTILHSPSHQLAGARIAAKVEAITGSLSEFQITLELPNADEERYMDVYDAIFPWAMSCMERLEAPFRPLVAPPKSDGGSADLPVQFPSQRLKAS